MSQENQKKQKFGDIYHKKDWAFMEFINKPTEQEFIEVMMRVSDGKPTDGDEIKWANWLSYTEWFKDEIEAGLPWARIKKRLEEKSLK